MIQEEGWTERLRQPSWISTAGLEFAGIPEVPVQPGWSHRKGKKGWRGLDLGWWDSQEQGPWDLRQKPPLMLARDPAVDSVRTEAETQRQAGRDTSVKASKNLAYLGQWTAHLYTWQWRGDERNAEDPSISVDHTELTWMRQIKLGKTEIPWDCTLKTVVLFTRLSFSPHRVVSGARSVYSSTTQPFSHRGAQSKWQYVCGSREKVSGWELLSLPVSLRVEAPLRVCHSSSSKEQVSFRSVHHQLWDEWMKWAY